MFQCFDVLMFFSFILFIYFCASSCFASSPILDQPNIKSAVDVFLKTLKEASLKKKKTSTATLMPDKISKHTWTVSLSKSLPLKKECRTDDKTKKKSDFYNHSHAAGVGYGYERFGAFLSASGYRYQQPWNPDFSFAFGYYDWSPGGICFEYRNDGANRFNPKKDEKVVDLDSGGVSLSYRISIPEAVQKVLKFKADNPLGFSIGTSVIKKYYDAASNTKKNLKHKISFSVSYQIAPPLSFGMGFGIFLKNSKQPWDSDFTYQLSYNIPLPRGQLNISYANYGPTRYPWNQKVQKTRLVPEHGSITLSWSCKINELFKSTEQSSAK